jgi:glycosidase
MATSIFAPDVEATFRETHSPRTIRVRVDGRPVDIQTPFPSPADWRDQWIYFLLVDRFNNPSALPKNTPFDGLHGVRQGGTFDGVRAQLGYLQQLGAGAIWLSPVLKNCQYNPFSYHGYGIQDFLEVDPKFASDPEAAREHPVLAEQELRAVVDEAHARGMYVILDIVLNHAGDVFQYVLEDGRIVPEAPPHPTPYQITWRDENGNPRPDWTTAPERPPLDAAIWPDQLRRNEVFRRRGRGGEAGGDFESLKEFVTDLQVTDPEHGTYYPVRNALIRAYQYLIAKYDFDGFRIDTLKYIEPDFALTFGNAMREFALGIGKKNFFTFGEVYDNEEQIARFIGRNAGDNTELIGVDAALDFPLFFVLPGVAKGMRPPSDVIGMFAHRKEVERAIISSHGEAGRYFVTFLDNHDQRERFYFSQADAPLRFADQLSLGVGCLFSLQGIPCLYYGTEQGLHGSGAQDSAVREALWGKPNAFDDGDVFYRAIASLSEVRNMEPALRYGRQYFRPISGDGVHFGVSTFTEGVLAYSRILNDREVVVVANTSTTRPWSGEVIVDRSLNPAGSIYVPLFTNKSVRPAAGGGASPAPVADKADGSVEIREVDGRITRGPARTLPVTLAPMELQILVKP